MHDSVIRLQAFGEEYLKIATEIATKAKSEVYKDVVRKYPHLAAKQDAPSEKAASAIDGIRGGLRRAGEHLHHHEDAYELGGLGVLGAIGADRIQAHARAGAGAGEHAIEKRQLGGASSHAAADVAGLGMLAAPIAAKKLLGR